MISPPLTSSTKGKRRRATQEQRAVQLPRSDGILVAVALVSVILCLVSFSFSHTSASFVGGACSYQSFGSFLNAAATSS